MIKRINWKVLVVCLVVVYAIAFIGGIFTSSQTNSEWYQGIKPDITPPNYVFPIVWNILFFMIALSLYTVWTKNKDRNKIIFVYGINLLLNVFWSFLFFAEQNVVGAFYELIVLWFSIWLMIYVSGKIDKKASYLLIPYLVWVGFAGYLNWIIAFG